MLFRAPILAGIAAGEITLAFRRWRRPTVRAGGTLRTPVGVLAIDAVDAVGTVTAAEARRAGYASVEALLADLGDRDGTLYRIAFRRISDDPRVALREDATLSPEVRDAIAARLAALDARGPWTRATLALIAGNEGVAAADLARRLGLETPVLKRRIRRLKEVGLSESLTTGYRLSPRGRAFVAADRW